jgi:PAS domain S-box-containing protein
MAMAGAPEEREGETTLMPRPYDHMTKAQLIEELRRREARTAAPGGGLEEVVHDLQVHQEEIRVQNEQLMEVQRSLEESRDRYADLYDFAPVGYATLDRNGIITEMNLTAAGYFGIERGHLIGTPMIVHVASGDRPRFMEHLKRCQRGDETTVQTELEIDRRGGGGGGRIPISLSSSALGPAKRGDAYRTALIDLTGQRHAERERQELLGREQAAKAASEAKDRFLAVLSHELRTPLTPVLAAVSALEGQRVPKGIAPMLRMIRRNVQMEANLIDDLLDITRINRNKLKIEFGEVNVNAVADEVVGMCREELDDRRMILDLRLGAAHPVVRGDPMRLRQVIWNLLRNAIKFTPARGTIAIATENPQPDRLRLTVSDTGVGITPELRQRIFKPFEQAEAANGDRAAGLGLGLAICKALIDAHEGEISVDSAGPGKGTVFTILLPCLPHAIAAGAAPPKSKGTAAAAPPARDAHRLSILLVEDHPDTAHIMAKLLRARGHRVRSAASVREALAAAAADPFDLLISDIGLPDGTGQQLMAELRNRRRGGGGDIQGIALSGFGSEEDIRKSKAAGFAEHLVKPIDFDRLTRVIAAIANRE